MKTNHKFVLAIFIVICTTFSVSAKHPVVFLHGWNSDGSVWSKMKSLLISNMGYESSELFAYSYYNKYFGYSTSDKIETIAAGVAAEITETYYDAGEVPVDVVGHSMGGLLIRTMLANDLIDKKCLGRFIAIAAPNYGQNIGSLGGVQAGQMKYGSKFLWDLADAWHYRNKKLAETLCIAGACDTENGSKWDGLIHTWSASLDDAPVRYVYRRHSDAHKWWPRFWDIYNIYSCAKGTNDSVYKLVSEFLKSGKVLSQDLCDYTPPEYVYTQGGIFFQVIRPDGSEVYYPNTNPNLAPVYWHEQLNKRIIADFLEHGYDDHETQKYGIELVYGTMPQGTYRLTVDESDNTLEFQVSGVPVYGGRMSVVRLRTDRLAVYDTARVILDSCDAKSTKYERHFPLSGNNYVYNLPTPTWNDRIFEGWYTLPAGGELVQNWSLAPKHDTILYAHWKEALRTIYDYDNWNKYYTGGDNEWVNVYPGYRGNYSFKSGPIEDYSASWLEKTVTGSGKLSFVWKVSSEENYDKLILSVDGSICETISGKIDEWATVISMIAGEGEHKIRWTYIKDAKKISGSDCGWVDAIEWKPEVTVVLYGNGGTIYGYDTYTKRWYSSESKYVSIPKPLRSGYTFKGWYDSPLDSGHYVEEVSMITDTPGETTYYAHWQYDVPVGWYEIAMDFEDLYQAEDNGAFNVNLRSLTSSKFEPKYSVKGLPPGLKFDQKTQTISGTATKPGVYTVTVNATSVTVTKPVVKTFTLTVPNLVCEVLPNLLQARDAYGTIYTGVAFDPSLVDCSAKMGWTVMASGLPTGLRFDSKTGTITGVPTKTGTHTVTFTATKSGEKAQISSITLTISSLPNWAQGTFVGCLGEFGKYGSATLTVSATGKISGKLAHSGKSWTISVPCYDSVCSCNDIDWGIWECGDFDMIDKDSPVFSIIADAKSGRETIQVLLFVCNETMPEGLRMVNSIVAGFFDDDDWRCLPIVLRRNMWKDKATANAAKSVLSDWTGTYTAQLLRDEYSWLPGENPGDCCGYLSITVSADGTVKASGKLGDGTSISSSSPLLYDPNTEGYPLYEGGYNWYAVVYASPSSYKGGAFLALLGFNGPRGTIASKFFPDMDLSGMWHNLNPTSGYNYGEGFSLDFYVNGAYYDKLAKLSDYYDAMRVNIFAPELRYTFKETVLGVSGRKQTETWAEYAESSDLSAQSGLVVGINGKGTGFLVEKTTRPVQDKVTKQWVYNGANDGRLTLSFTQATGIFKGSYTFWYDYVSAFDNTTGKATNAHNSKKVNFEGIFVQGADGLKGFYPWEATGGEEKTYKFKMPYPVWLTPLQ